jgi:hypothetical protein
MRIETTRRQMSLFIVSLSAALPGLFSFMRSAGAAVGSGPSNYHITAKSGEPHIVTRAWPSTVGGNPSAFSLKVSQQAKHGSVSIQQSAGVSTVIYRSKPGYIGKDDFAYVRTGSDKFAGTYTIAVTVR